MKNRERIISTLNHKEPDRLPVDLGSTDSSGITWIAYNNLKRALGLSTKTQVFDLMQMIVKVEHEVLQFVGSDAAALIFEPEKWKTFEFIKGYPLEIPEKVQIQEKDNGEMIIYSGNGMPACKRPKCGFYFDTIYNPLKDSKSLEDIDKGFSFMESYDMPYYMDESFDSLKQRARNLHQNTDYAVVANLWVHLLAAGQDLRGFENFMMDLILNKKMAQRFFEKQIEAYIPRIDRYIEMVGDYIDIIQVNDDLGTQNGPQFNRELYKEILKPYHKKLWQYIKQKSKKYLLLHSCGSIYELIPDLIEIGIDAINPVQVSARNMDSKKLKIEFGKDITFWGGGCDTQKILPFGKPGDVKEEVKKRVEDLSGNGGFVFCQVHNIQPDVPVENILAMYEAVREFSD
ncbi:MAG: uroporphyrinogen decarboxylase family protein [Actinobacteria bacterium]|nr:uroporphyrinogen decarboxylase family protein [Actinomycetota bacterium]